MDVVLSLLHLLVAAAEPALLRDALALHKGLRGPPVDALPRRLDLGVQLVDLLERPALGLVDKEVDKGDTDKAAAEPDEEDLRLQVGVAGAVVDEIGGGVSNGPVEEPLSREVSHVPVLPMQFSWNGRDLLTFVAVVILKLLARNFRGKISPVTTHARGPHVDAKKKM